MRAIPLSRRSGLRPPRRRRIRRTIGLAATLLLAAGAATLLSLPSSPVRQDIRPAAQVAIAKPSPASLSRLFDPAPMMHAEARAKWPSAPLHDRLRVAAAPQAGPTGVAAPANLAEDRADKPRLASVPLPVPRPPELAGAAPSEQRAAGRAGPRRARIAAAPEPQPDSRNFLERLFGIAPAPTSSPAPKLAYAALGGGSLPIAPEPRISPAPAAPAEGGVAVYDISAGTVTLPNGDRLEAHSGLGDKMDEPRFVHVRMKGATPPGTYELTEREAPFHGVRAIRMNPVGGSAAIFGRTGILAHHYLLGPRGDSNGCVSFKDYDRFLQAFLNGEVRRLVVVPGRGGALPAIATGSSPAPRDS